MIGLVLRFILYLKMVVFMLKVLDVFVGLEIGFLKGINVFKVEWLNLYDIEFVDKLKEIVLLCWKDEMEIDVCIGFKNRIVMIWNLVI